jgi:hypothetical protein
VLHHLPLIYSVRHLSDVDALTLLIWADTLSAIAGMFAAVFFFFLYLFSDMMRPVVNGAWGNFRRWLRGEWLLIPGSAAPQPKSVEETAEALKQLAEPTEFE